MRDQGEENWGLVASFPAALDRRERESAKGATYDSEVSAEGAEYDSQGKCEYHNTEYHSAEGAEYVSQGQVRAKRARRPW